MNLMLMLSCPFSVQGREPYLQDLKKKILCCFVFRHLRTDFFKLGMMIKTTKLYILISVWITLTFIHGHSCIRNQKLWCPFSWKFQSQFGVSSAFCHSLWLCWSSGKIYFVQVIFWEKSANMILWNNRLTLPCQDSREPISVKLGNTMMLLNCTFWFQFEWPWCSFKDTGLRES